MFRYLIKSDDLINDFKNADGVVDCVSPTNSAEYEEFQQTYEEFCDINGYTYIEVSTNIDFGVLLCIVDDDMFDYEAFLIEQDEEING